MFLIQEIYAICPECIGYEKSYAGDRTHIIGQQDVLDFHSFFAHRYMILIDSGGIKTTEAPSLIKQVLTMRDTIERLERIRVGTLNFVMADEQVIYNNFKLLMINQYECDKLSQAIILMATYLPTNEPQTY